MIVRVPLMLIAEVLSDPGKSTFVNVALALACAPSPKMQSAPKKSALRGAEHVSAMTLCDRENYPSSNQLLGSCLPTRVRAMDTTHTLVAPDMLFLDATGMRRFSRSYWWIKTIETAQSAMGWPLNTADCAIPFFMDP